MFFKQRIVKRIKQFKNFTIHTDDTWTEWEGKSSSSYLFIPFFFLFFLGEHEAEISKCYFSCSIIIWGGFFLYASAEWAVSVENPTDKIEKFSEKCRKHKSGAWMEATQVVSLPY